MTIETICEEDRKILLEIARRSVESASLGKRLPAVDLKGYSEALRAEGASFVTLTVKGALRGCIGALEAYQPLIRDVVEHASSAAIDDYRFQPVRPEEVPSLDIEVSVLTKPIRLTYSGPDELLEKLTPGVDGVILKDGRMRATFLPQVWDQLPEKEEFLAHLCSKMGAPTGLWKIKNLEVFTYQVEEFHE
jgi:AmmeMemoRadiSam system protein A